MEPKSKALDTCHTWYLRYRTFIRTKKEPITFYSITIKLTNYGNKFYLNAPYKVALSNNTAIKVSLIFLLDSDSF